ncbi:4Fe-4S dicluster domain-containing protein [Streptomyces sp. NPDC002055]|uniref:4Fe-4S dicluster domain-containing protein n=1 Tax=Streptomyces sp. NPDC002055 TaxID=3154534 RepID=UPI003324CCF3
MMGRTIFIDPGRCTGCQACVAACRECDSHRGISLIHLDPADEGHSVASLPTVCMHCEDPVAPCAAVCPADAILTTPDGVVQQADASRCFGCSDCVSACPFGVPEIDLRAKLQRKCDLCYDRTSQGLGPMCATVCPTGALFYGTLDELRAERPGVEVADSFVFGETQVRTGVAMVVPADKARWPVPGGLPIVEVNGADVR